MQCVCVYGAGGAAGDKVEMEDKVGEISQTRSHKELQFFGRKKMDFPCFPQKGEDEKLVAMEVASMVDLVLIQKWEVGKSKRMELTRYCAGKLNT